MAMTLINNTTINNNNNNNKTNHLGDGPVVRVWDQEVYSLCGLRFEPCGCSYDGYWRLTWSLTSGPVRLVEVHASWPCGCPNFFFIKPELFI